MKSVVSLLLGVALIARAQTALPLWPEGAPGALGKEDKDIPTITPFLASAEGTNAAMVVFPGGGYAGLAPYEGKTYAEWFASNGISGFVVKYRLGSHGYHHPAMMQDAARAVRMVRARAAEWHVDPNRIGVIGSSAGGHLAATLLTHFDQGQPDASDPIDRESCRPTLGILCYAVITMGPNTHNGSKKNLLGDNPDSEVVKTLSNETQVTKDTPPCFIWHTWEDHTVKVENSLDFAYALQKAGVPYDLHIYQKGGHGLGLGGAKMHPWTRDCLYWLKARQFIH